MATLSGQTIANTFDSILHVEDDTAGLVASSTDSRVIQDGVGANSALALATDSVRITSTNKLYINDVGGEYISGDGTDLTIAAGTDLNLTAGTDINIPVNVGLRFGDGGENIETDNTDFTITSGGKLNLAPTSDVHTANGTGVVMGHTAQVAFGELTSEAQILGTAEADATLAIGLWSTTDALSPSLKFLKSGHASIGVSNYTTVADNEELGKIQAYGADGTDLGTLSSEIAFNIDDDGVGAGTLGGEILLKTSGKDGTLDTAVTIDSSQNVGIGVTPHASWKSTATAFQIGASGSMYLDPGYFVITENIYHDGTNTRYLTTSHASSYVQGDGAHIFNTTSSGSADAVVTPTECMRIDSAGNVGIGTASPSQVLEVNGRTLLDRVDLTGPFYLSSDVTGSLGEWQNEHSSTPSGFDIKFNTGSPNDTTQYFLRGIDSGGTEFNIFSDGSFAQASDIRDKNVLGLTGNQLDNILSIDIKDYNAKGDESEKLHIGVVAQELVEIYPHLVTHVPEIPARYDDGVEVSCAVEDRYLVYKIGLIFPLIKAIQELSAKVEALENA